MGVYSSPHLISPVERITVDGVPIGEDAFAEWTAQMEKKGKDHGYHG